MQEITLANDLENDKSHEVILFKRQDGCHEFTFYGFIVPNESKILIASKKPRKCIEFYGDSTVAGELIDDVDYVIKQNPKHNGEYSNAWYSYAMVTARNLKAQVSIIAQEGISLLDDTGEFQEPIELEWKAYMINFILIRILGMLLVGILKGIPHR